MKPAAEKFISVFKYLDNSREKFAQVMMFNCHYFTFD